MLFGRPYPWAMDDHSNLERNFFPILWLQAYCCVLELGEAKFQQIEASWQSFKQRGWAIHFIDLTSLYLIDSSLEVS